MTLGRPLEIEAGWFEDARPLPLYTDYEYYQKEFPKAMVFEISG